MFKKLSLLFFIASLSLSACGTFEVSIEGTSTPASAEETLTPTVTSVSHLQPTITHTPVLQYTPTPTQAGTTVVPCDLAEFVTDVSVPDGTHFKPREAFTKTWRLKNVGTCTWTTGYVLVFVSGEAMLVPEPKPLISNVAPGGMVDISVNMTAPAASGVYNGFWGLRNASGTRVPIVGSSSATFYVNIRVVPEFAGFKVNVDSLTVTCQKPDLFTVTAVLSSNGPGIVSYRLANGGSEPPPATELIFDEAATKTVSRDIPFSVIIPSHPEIAWVQILLSWQGQDVAGDQVPLLCP